MEDRIRFGNIFKIVIIFLLILICTILTIYNHFYNYSTTIFTHFFYVPIILATLWWGRRGILVAIFLALFLVISHIIARSYISASITGDVIRSIFLILVSILLVLLIERIKNVEKTFGDVIETLPIALFVIDKEHTILHWNKACEILTGFPAQKMIGTKKHMEAYGELRVTLADLIVDGIANIEEIKKQNFPNIKWWKSELGKDVYKGEGFFPFVKDGRWLHITAAPLRDINGNIIGAIETLEDITSLKEMEQEIYQNQKMISLGRLAGGVVHEFNNLLTVIRANLELLFLKTKKEHALHSHLDNIKKAALQASELVEQLLIFIRKSPMKMQVFDLNKTVEDMAKMLKDMLGKKICLKLETERDLWKIKGNPQMIGQVIMNLVINAKDAMPDGGEIIIKTENFYKDEEDKIKKFVCLYVKDTGIGMSEEIRSHIFDPFFTTKESGRGTGLGLAMVYGIIKQHGGHIEVESTPNKGTTFILYLPALD